MGMVWIGLVRLKSCLVEAGGSLSCCLAGAGGFLSRCLVGVGGSPSK
jgi:hypothetical protein